MVNTGQGCVQTCCSQCCQSTKKFWVFLPKYVAYPNRDIPTKIIVKRSQTLPGQHWLKLAATRSTQKSENLFKPSHVLRGTGYPEICTTQSDEERERCVSDEWPNEENDSSIYTQHWGWRDTSVGLHEPTLCF